VTVPLAEGLAPKVIRAKGVGLGPPITTVMPPTLGVTPTITITSPSPGATLAADFVQIEGTFTGPTNTGISVLGVPAQTYQNRFVSPPVRLAPGTITATARATTIDGLIAESTVTLNVAPIANDFGVSAIAYAGFKPFRVKFQIAPRAVAPQSVAVDFNGDGSDDFSGSGSNVPAYTYLQSGIFTARIRVTASNGQVTTQFRTIASISMLETRASVCATYALLRSRLQANDTIGALKALTPAFAFDSKPVIDALSVANKLCGANACQ
jgi:hypothetical protein